MTADVRLSVTKVAPFAAELRRAMTARGYAPTRLAHDLGIVHGNIWRWSRGLALPSLEVADHLADLLDWQSLRSIVMASRRRRCARCRRTYYYVNRVQKYCGQTCKHAVDIARANGRSASKTRASVKRLQAAIAEHCRGCEPLGLCRDATCALRPVSPLPLVKRRAA